MYTLQLAYDERDDIFLSCLEVLDIFKRNNFFNRICFSEISYTNYVFLKRFLSLGPSQFKNTFEKYLGLPIPDPISYSVSVTDFGPKFAICG